MGIFDKLFHKQKKERGPTLTQGAKDFIEGRKHTLTSADVNPDGAEKYGRYERAMALKKSGDLAAAAELLVQSCDPPSIYKGHYEELFKIWRQFNKRDLKEGNHQAVVNRVLTMARLDDEMIKEMLRYWSIQQKRQLPADYFDRDRNLKVSDAKAFLKAAEELGDGELIRWAVALVGKFTTQ